MFEFKRNSYKVNVYVFMEMNILMDVKLFIQNNDVIYYFLDKNFKNINFDLRVIFCLEVRE